MKYKYLFNALLYIKTDDIINIERVYSLNELLSPENRILYINILIKIPNTNIFIIESNELIETNTTYKYDAKNRAGTQRISLTGKFHKINDSELKTIAHSTEELKYLNRQIKSFFLSKIFL